MNYYYDTSALCRHYHTESGSEKVDNLLNDASARHVISRVGYVEVQSAFALKVRTGDISAGDFALLRRRLRADVNARTLLVVRLLRRHFDQAEKLIQKTDYRSDFGHWMPCTWRSRSTCKTLESWAPLSRPISYSFH